MLTVLWHDYESSGFTDNIPLEWLLSDGICKGVVHHVSGPRSGQYRAKCNIIVSGPKADLDYRPYADFNEKEGMDLGVLRIVFSGIDRSTVSNVLWKYKGERGFKSYPVTVGYSSNSPQDFEAKVSASLKLSSETRRKRLASAPKKPGVVKVITTSYLRNPDVVAEVLFRANGRCEICKKPAPFKRADSAKPYLEVHHKIRLADRGEDTVENAIAACPNCHREAHYGMAQHLYGLRLSRKKVSFRSERGKRYIRPRMNDTLAATLWF